MASLVGVMIIICTHTFNRASVSIFFHALKFRTFVSVCNALTIAAVMGVAIWSNLVFGAGVGVLIECLVFTWESSKRLHFYPDEIKQVCMGFFLSRSRVFF